MKNIVVYTEKFHRPSTAVRFTDPISVNNGLFHETGDGHNFLQLQEQREFINVPNADVYVFQRPDCKYGKAMKDAYRVGKCVIVDFDDALWECATDSEGNDVHENYAWMFRNFSKYIHGAVFSTQYIADSYNRNINPHTPRIVMPNAVRTLSETIHDEKVIFYGGSGQYKLSHFSDSWFRALNILVEKGYRVISSTDIPVPHEKFQTCAYAYYLTAVQNCHPSYYIAPCADCPESRGKSNLKELEAAELGCKFIGQGDAYSNGLPYDAGTDDILNAFENAVVPKKEDDWNVYSTTYSSAFLSVYAGLWLKGGK